MKSNFLVLHFCTFLFSVCKAAAIDFNGPLSQNAVNERTFVPDNFSLSFDLTPFGTVYGWSSIIHYSNSDFLSRIPAIWFTPGTTKLAVDVSTTNRNEFKISVSSLPLNSKTNVRVEAVGREVFLFLNNSFDSMATVLEDRIFGQATLYVSSAWYTPALASIKSFQMKSITAFSTSSDGFNDRLSQYAVYETSFVPANFSLSFDIKPFGTDSGWTNIIHYSKDKTNGGAGGRIPAIWFTPGTTKLAIRVSTTANINDGIDTSIASLPLNSKTNVRVEAVGREVFLFLNNSFDSMATLSADRIFGEATLYASNPWHTPALASIESIKMELPFSVKAANVFNGRLDRFALYEYTTVPKDFALSFDITPFATDLDSTSIILYRKGTTAYGVERQIPAIFFIGNTTILAVRVATTANVNEEIRASGRSLPLNATTNIRVEAFGRDVFLYLNNSLDTMVTVSADRISGEATLYASNPWHTTASVSIGSIQMTPFSFNPASNFKGPLSMLAVYRNTFVTANFALSFDIKPFGTVSDLASILYYRKSDMGSAAGIPAISFYPGTTKLTVGIATLVNLNAGIEVSNAFLPLNTTTNVRVEAFGRYVLLYLNNTLDTIATVSADRIFGEATLYVSHPRHPPALATIGWIKMESLSTLSFKSAKTTGSAASKKAVTIPANFSLSFNIKPSRTVSELTSIIRYCKDNTDIVAGGRMPAIFFLPGTTKLHVRVATTTDMDDGIWGSTKSLPLKTTTNVRVEAFGRDIILYLNGSFDSMTTVSANRISGAAFRYNSDPWWSSAQATISSIRMISLSNKQFTSASKFNGPLSKLAVYETVVVPANFNLTFTIQPLGTVPELSSIIHYCQNNTDLGVGGRMPAIWFVAGTTKLHVRVATTDNVNAGIFASIKSLPLNAKTTVRVEAFDREVFLFLNNSFDSMASLSADRISGAATLFLSNPWQPSALASVGSIQMRSLSALTVTSATFFNGRLSKFAVYERTVVPTNFALSFNITPSHISPEWSSIIHYSKDKTDMGPGGRMPAIWFIPGTTKLTVRVATTDNTNDGIFASIGSLPLNTTTDVRVEAFGRYVLLYLNNSLDIIATVSADRIFGEAILFAPNPWSTPALASIGYIEMKSISSLSGRAANGFNGPLSELAVYESTFIPANFALSFNISPFGTVSGWTNIIHYTSKDTDLVHPILAIFFHSESTNLHVRVATADNNDNEIKTSIASLPLDATTNVRVEAFGRDVFLFLNNSFDSKVTVLADRIFGEATLYASNPWHTPASASVGSIELKSLSSLSVNSARDFNGRLTKLAVYELARIVPAKFAFSFDIKPHGTVSDLASIIHYTQDIFNVGSKNGILAIWFVAGTTKLEVRVFTESNTNEGIWSSRISLPLNVITNVRVEAIGREVYLFLNNTFDCMVTLSADRVFGEATLYASNPWYTPASASIGSIQMISISSLSVSTAADFNGRLTRLAVFERTTIVPANFNLSLNINPNGIVASTASIIEYSQDISGVLHYANYAVSGRVEFRNPIPIILAIGFVRGTTKLQVEVSTTSQRNAEIFGSITSLPLNATTNVQVKAYDRDVFLYLNNTLDSMVTVSADRIFGKATLYASNSWNTPASASIGSIQMTPL